MQKRARLTETPGFGQDTGQDHRRRIEEAERLIEIIRSCPAYEPDNWEETFLRDMEQKLACWGMSATVTGKQVMKLRDIKDKAIEA